MRRSRLLPLLLVTIVAAPLSAQDLDEPRPIDGTDTVLLEEMTWMEVRDALAAGTTTVIVGTGGLEQNGPFVASGKHNFVLSATTEAIARELGDALVAPIVKFVPEGTIDPPSGISSAARRDTSISEKHEMSSECLKFPRDVLMNRPVNSVLSE